MKQYCQDFGHQATKDSNLGEMGDKMAFPVYCWDCFQAMVHQSVGVGGTFFFFTSLELSPFLAHIMSQNKSQNIK